MNYLQQNIQIRSQMPDFLNKMLSSAKRDDEVKVDDGRPAQRLLHGMTMRDLNTNIDRRGSIFEIYDSRWGWHSDPIEFAYCFTVRPGVVKGWGIHLEHEDRYCLIQGEIDLVLFDPREDSPTFRQVCRIQLSEKHRKIVSIPRFVWHADHNVGSVDATVINFPTQPYNHKSPDKYRLPIDTDLIPYDFGNAAGG